MSPMSLAHRGHLLDDSLSLDLSEDGKHLEC